MKLGGGHYLYIYVISSFFGKIKSQKIQKNHYIQVYDGFSPNDFFLRKLWYIESFPQG